MAVTLNSTGITFSDGTSLSTAAGNTGANEIGTYVIGRPLNFTTYGLNSTIAGTSLYSTSANAVVSNSKGAYWNVGSGASLIGGGSWRCVSTAPTYTYQQNQYQVGGSAPGLWVRYA